MKNMLFDATYHQLKARLSTDQPQPTQIRFLKSGSGPTMSAPQLKVKSRGNPRALLLIVPCTSRSGRHPYAEDFACKLFFSYQLVTFMLARSCYLNRDLSSQTDHIGNIITLQEKPFTRKYNSLIPITKSKLPEPVQIALSDLLLYSNFCCPKREEQREDPRYTVPRIKSRDDPQLCGESRGLSEHLRRCVQTIAQMIKGPVLHIIRERLFLLKTLPIINQDCANLINKFLIGETKAEVTQLITQEIRRTSAIFHDPHDSLSEIMSGIRGAGFTVPPFMVSQ